MYFADGGTVKVLLSAFRELCGLLWFLHVRDQLSKYLRVLQPSPLKVSYFNIHVQCSPTSVQYHVPTVALIKAISMLCKILHSLIRPCLVSV